MGLSSVANKRIMRTYMLIIISLFTSFSLSAQSASLRIDSLKKVLQAQKEDTNKVITLNKLSESFVTIADNDSAKQYAIKALSLSVKLNYKKGEADANYNAGNALNNQYDPKTDAETYEYYSTALLLYKQLSMPESAANAYYYIGNLKYNEGDYNEALDNDYKAMNES